MNSFGDAWELVCSYCKTKITDVAYNTWIVRIKPLELDFDANTSASSRWSWILTQTLPI